MEVAHGQVMAPKNPHMGDILSIFIQSLRSGDHIVQALPAQLTAIDGKADRRFPNSIEGYMACKAPVIAELYALCGLQDGK